MADSKTSRTLCKKKKSSQYTAVYSCVYGFCPVEDAFSAKFFSIIRNTKNRDF